MMVQFIALLTIHFVADFVLQSHWMASHKSKNNRALAIHVLVYSLALMMLAAPVFMLTATPALWALFIVLNGVLHFLTDYCTSRWSSRLWAKQEWHNFFVVIGLDQLIHQVTLGATMLLFFGRSA